MRRNLRIPKALVALGFLGVVAGTVGELMVVGSLASWFTVTAVALPIGYGLIGWAWWYWQMTTPHLIGPCATARGFSHLRRLPLRHRGQERSPTRSMSDCRGQWVRSACLTGAFCSRRRSPVPSDSCSRRWGCGWRPMRVQRRQRRRMRLPLPLLYSMAIEQERPSR